MRAWKIAGGLCGGATFEGVVPPTPTPGFFQDFETNSDGFEAPSSTSYPWVRTQTWAASGSWSYASSNQQMNSSTSTTRLTLNLQSSSLLTFDFKIISEQSYDGLMVTITTSTGSTTWQRSDVTIDSGTNSFSSGMLSGTAIGRASINLQAGETIVTFTYQKDGSQSTGEDTAWIDNVRVAASS